jgi:hypothetical protein
MKKKSMSLLVGFFLITLTSSVFAQSTNPNPWEETAIKRNGEYYQITAPIDYSKVIKPKNKLAPVDYSKVVVPKSKLAPIDCSKTTQN